VRSHRYRYWRVGLRAHISKAGHDGKVAGRPALLLGVWVGWGYGDGGALCLLPSLRSAFQSVGRRVPLSTAGYGERIAFLRVDEFVVMYPGGAASMAVGSDSLVATRSRKMRWLAMFFRRCSVTFGAIQLLGTGFSGPLVPIVNVRSSSVFGLGLGSAWGKPT